MDGMVNLTAIWKDAGLQKHQRPFHWARKDGANAIAATMAETGLPSEQVFFSASGRGGASWGHHRVAEAYALYVDAEVRRAREARTFDIADEKWIGLVTFQGYDVSDYGRVRSYWSNNGELVEHPKLVGNHVKNSGHISVALFKDRTRNPKRFCVHQLVLEAFIGPCPDGMQGCHNDGNPANNRLDNLRWDTNSSNQRDKLRHDTQQNVVLSEDDIPVIWARLVRGERISAIAADFKCHVGSIYNIRKGKGWSHITSKLPGWPLEPLIELSPELPIYIAEEFSKSESEIWRVVSDWPSLMISAFGRVMGCMERKAGGRRGEWHASNTWRLRPVFPNVNGHMIFTAADGTTRSKTFYVHHLVLTAFACPRPQGAVACHIDGNPANNHASNLRWDSQNENARDRFRHAKERTASNGN